MSEASVPGNPAVRDRLASALLSAMKRRDTVAVAALRSALADIGNAEAVAVTEDTTTPTATSEHVAGAAAGLGAAEVERRILTEVDMIGILAADAMERDRAAVRFDEAGRPDQADRLRAEADVLRSVIETA